MRTDTETVVKVGISDAKVARAPDKLRTTGLGSCVGVVLFDDKHEIAGMAHVMLPDSSMAKKEQVNPLKYADTAIAHIYDKLVEKGMKRNKMKAILAGGAQMFRLKSSSDLMRIGPRNVEAVKKELESRGVMVVQEDTGGSNGRTIEFDISVGELSIRTVSEGVKVLK